MITDHGCDARSPGIGDIAYVKDLMTGRIVTTTFKCSVFGDAKSRDTFYKSGWVRTSIYDNIPCYNKSMIAFFSVVSEVIMQISFIQSNPVFYVSFLSNFCTNKLMRFTTSTKDSVVLHLVV